MLNKIPMNKISMIKAARDLYRELDATYPYLRTYTEAVLKCQEVGFDNRDINTMVSDPCFIASLKAAKDFVEAHYEFGVMVCDDSTGFAKSFPYEDMAQAFIDRLYIKSYEGRKED